MTCIDAVVLDDNNLIALSNAKVLDRAYELYMIGTPQNCTVGHDTLAKWSTVVRGVPRCKAEEMM